MTVTASIAAASTAAPLPGELNGTLESVMNAAKPRPIRFGITIGRTDRGANHASLPSGISGVSEIAGMAHAFGFQPRAKSLTSAI